MDRYSRLIGPVTAAGLLLTLCACATIEPTSSPSSPAPQPSTPPAPAAATPAEASATAETTPSTAPADAGQAAPQDRDNAKKARQREQKLARLRRDLEMARLRRTKAQLVLANAEAAFEQTVAKAESELAIAREKLRIFDEFRQPNRVARAELDLQRAEDRMQNDTEELQQLEIMYSDEQLADQTKEIVIDRAKRQLQRTQRDLELRRQELRTLVEVTLPLEREELELQVTQKEHALAQARRNHETRQMDNAVAAKKAEAELIKLEEEIVDLEEEIAEAAADAAAGPEAATKEAQE